MKGRGRKVAEEEKTITLGEKTCVSCKDENFLVNG
jgi:hypothetical protein